jgi:hypothetical protein
VAKRVRAFVPAADEVKTLHEDRGPVSEIFRKIATEGHYRTRRSPTSTRQGLYAIGPDGAFLGSVNSNDPRRVARMLDAALEAFEAGDGATPRGGPLASKDAGYPEKGLVLRLTVRDLPRGPDGEKGGWNRDYAWFRAAEAAEMVPDKDDPGCAREWPTAVARRFAQCHLVDFVRGQTEPWRRSEVRARIRHVVRGTNGTVVSLRIEGSVRSRSKDRGVTLGIEGRAEYDREAGRFVRYEMFAVGEREGGTRYNGREGDPGPSPIGFLAELADPDERIAPGLRYAYPW